MKIPKALANKRDELRTISFENDGFANEHDVWDNGFNACYEIMEKLVFPFGCVNCEKGLRLDKHDINIVNKTLECGASSSDIWCNECLERQKDDK